MSKEKDRKLLDKFMAIDSCLPSPPDARDYTVKTVALAEAPIPEEYICKDMKIINQGAIGSCVAHACATAMGYGELKSGMTSAHDFSRGYIYGNRKATDYQGEGMYVRQALKQLNHCGDCEVEDFPYNEVYPQVKARIDKDKERLAKLAKDFKIVNYFRCYTKEEVQRALLNQGAVVISITLYSSFTGDCPLPTAEDEKRGGHAMCVVGWDKTGWIIQNSWGRGWGNKGFLHLPYEYPVDEFWGLTVNPNVPEPKKKPWTTVLANAVKYWLLWLWAHVKIFFRRNTETESEETKE